MLFRLLVELAEYKRRKKEAKENEKVRDLFEGVGIMIMHLRRFGLYLSVLDNYGKCKLTLSAGMFVSIFNRKRKELTEVYVWDNMFIFVRDFVRKIQFEKLYYIFKRCRGWIINNVIFRIRRLRILHTRFRIDIKINKGGVRKRRKRRK